MNRVDTLDSRTLRFTDCYGQRFMKSGRYRYRITPPGCAWLPGDHEFAVEVGAPSEKMVQHHVEVRADGATFTAVPSTVSIAAGDMVTWNCPQADAPPFAINGDRAFFSSEVLTNECGYSHVFSAPGRYEWVDAGGSGTCGVVEVADPKATTGAECRRWMETLAKGTLVMINDGRAEPEAVKITLGQTVFFAVVTGPGVTVTDRRLVGGGAEPKTASAPRTAPGAAPRASKAKAKPRK